MLRRTTRLVTGAILLTLGVALFVADSGSDAQAGRVTVLVSVRDPGVLFLLFDSQANLGRLFPGQEGRDSISGFVFSIRRWGLVYVATDLRSASGEAIPISEVRISGTSIPSPIQLRYSGSIYANMSQRPFFFPHYYTLVMPWYVSPARYEGIIIYTAIQM